MPREKPRYAELAASLEAASLERDRLARALHRLYNPPGKIWHAKGDFEVALLVSANADDDLVLVRMKTTTHVWVDVFGFDAWHEDVMGLRSLDLKNTQDLRFLAALLAGEREKRPAFAPRPVPVT